MPSPTKPTAKELADRLQPEHLDAEALREQIEQDKKEKENPPNPTSGGKYEREYPWQFHWVDGRGGVWEGEFVDKILSIRDRQLMGILRARLAGGIPFDQLDQSTLEINLMIAHLTYSLTKKPKWAEDLQALDDVRLLQEIYVEVADHEITFLGYGAHPAPSAS